MTSVLPPARRTRPPNRRELILAAATELFAARGYEYAGMSEIAEQVAVQPSALTCAPPASGEHHRLCMIATTCTF